MAKIHLVQSKIPLTEGQDQDAMCGVTVKNVIFGAFIDGSEGNGFDFTPDDIRLCQKCGAVAWKERYIYAVRERP